MTTRTDILTTSISLITGDRQTTYGPPLERWTILAGLWSAYLGVPIAPHDVGALMALDKISRIRVSPTHTDNYVDGCGYLANAGEIATDL